MEPQLRDLTNVFLNDASVSHRSKGSECSGRRTPITSGRSARPPGSGVGIDIRQTGRRGYGKINFKPVVEHSGDSYGPGCGAGKGVFTSIDIIEQCVKKIPEGPVEAKVVGAPNGDTSPAPSSPGRGRPLHQGERQAKPRPAPGADTDVYEHPAAADNAEGLRTGRRADHRAVDRPLYRLFGEVNEAMTYFEMTKTMVKKPVLPPGHPDVPWQNRRRRPPSPGGTSRSTRTGCITCRSCQRKCP